MDKSTKIKVGIIGASGFTGQELMGLLFRHPSVDLKFISSQTHVEKRLGEIFPQFSNSDMSFINLEQALELKDKVDLVFFTTPNNIAVKEAKKFLDQGISVIDFSADFRLKKNSDYKKYYGFEHQDLALLESASYGLVEYKRQEIQKLKKPFLIANPGCYTTAANLALIPVCKYGAEYLDLNSIIIDAKSGVSGAGKTLAASLTYNEVVENFKAYNIAGKHRHSPEINMILSEAADADIKVSFNPHLIPMFRGLYATSYIKTSRDFNFDKFYEYYLDFYKDEKYVKVLEARCLPETKWSYKNNMTFIGMDYDADTQTLIICSCLDNLVKGAAGQAVQNLETVFNLRN